jgi:16S rRNA (uracil1498-N3)-methyltransferase
MNQLILTQSDRLKNQTENQEDYLINDSLKVHHIKNILKLKVGDELRLAVINKGKFIGEILQFLDFDSKILVRILRKAETENPKESSIQLLIGLSRPPTLKKILEHGACMGVKSFYFFHSELSEKSYKDSKILGLEESTKLLHLGLSQSNTYYQLPEIKIFSSLHEAVNEIPPHHQCFILDKNSQNKFTKSSQDISLCFGSERGLTKNEMDFLLKKNFISVKVSATTLRVEHAVYYSLAQLEFINF